MSRSRGLDHPFPLRRVVGLFDEIPINVQNVGTIVLSVDPGSGEIGHHDRPLPAARFATTSQNADPRTAVARIVNIDTAPAGTARFMDRVVIDPAVELGTARAFHVQDLGSPG